MRGQSALLGLFMACAMTIGVWPAGARATFESKRSIERVFVQRSSNRQKETFITVRGEEELWIVEAFVRSSDGWQDPTWRKTFLSIEEVEKYLKLLNLTPQSEAQFESGHELRSSLTANEPLWKVTQTWNWQWELRYAEWVMQNADPEFFQRYQIATDCADVAYSMRWIFARIHGLPVAARMAGSGDLFTQDSVRPEWQRLPTARDWWEDKRFRKALDYLMNNTYTHTLVRDSYPISISQQSLTAGSHFLRLFGKTGHTQFVHRTHYNDPAALPLKLMSSTVPRSVRSLFETDFWENDPPVEGEGGFMHFRWPVHSAQGTTLVATNKMPYYSNEQFKPEFMKGSDSFALAVDAALNPGFSLESWLAAGIKDVATQITARKDIVEEGTKVCQQKSCAPGSTEYEDWSTPSRDKRLGQLLSQLQSVSTRRYPDRLQVIWDKAQQDPVLDLNGVTYSLAMIRFIWKDHAYSSEPYHPISRRWALEPDGFTANLAEQMTSSLNERDRKITQQGTACSSASGKCETAGSEWEKWQTFSEDLSLSRARLIDRQYCTNLPFHCAKYLQERQSRTIDFNGKSELLTAWLERAPWLNSDPNQNKAVRWGSLQNQFYSATFPAEQTATMSKSGWTLRKWRDHRSPNWIENVYTKDVLSAPTGFEWIAISPNGEWAVAQTNTQDQALLFDIARKSSIRFSLNSEAHEVLFTNDVFAMHDANTQMLHVFSLSPASTHLYDLMDIAEVSLLSAQGWIFTIAPNASATIYQLSTKPKNYPLAPMLVNHASKARWLYEADQNLIVELRNSEDLIETRALNKASGIWSPLPALNDFKTQFIGPHTALVSPSRQSELSGIFLDEFDTNLNLLDSRRLGDEGLYLENLVCLSFRGKFESSCHSTKGGVFDTKAQFTDRHVHLWDAKFLAWQQKSVPQISISPFQDPQRAIFTANFAIPSGNDGWYRLYAGQHWDYQLLVDANNPTQGSIVTFKFFEPQQVYLVGMPEGTLKAEQALTFELPSQEILWLQRK